KCGSTEFVPEKDIINTWATSSLTPTIVKDLLKDTKIYDNIKDKPMSIRRNGQDIITFWDFNTIVKSHLHYNMKPWNELYINGWMLGRDGRKMSKSLGNGVSPQEVVSEYGADVLRYLCASIAPATAVSFSEKELVAGKKFVNKLLNASKFVFMNLKDYDYSEVKNLKKVDELFLNKLNDLVGEVAGAYEGYNIFRVKQLVEQFFWKDFCDNYLEIVKKRVYQGEGEAKKSAQYVLYKSLLAILKMIAPIMPFISEEIYQEYFKESEKVKSIHVSEWPKADEVEDFALYDKFVDLLTKIRFEKSNAKKSMNSEIVLSLNKEDVNNLKGMEEDLKNVTNAKEIKEGKFKVEFN
ncbi:MAG: class I tRNA ligase family protein, partial [Candidatus Pacearchaeota archaeon]|nr:class I tRNA ligase family protein [Candidatus Pacearchaeota archaeon]